MESKFGPLPADIRAKIEQVAEISELDWLFDEVLSASTRADMPLPR